MNVLKIKNYSPKPKQNPVSHNAISLHSRYSKSKKSNYGSGTRTSIINSNERSNSRISKK